ncbi:hypothetical protein QTP88_003030 [Uroleucon formosanum]
MFGKSRIDLQLDEQRRSDVIRHNELGNFFGCLNLLSSYDSILNVHLETSKIFRGISNRIQSYLICSVSNIISTPIKSEIKNTNFVAILLDETSKITNLSQLSTTLRYVHHETGEAHERFISFVDVNADRSADGLLKHTDILYEVLQTKRLDILYCVKKIEETKFQLKNYRLNLFEKLWEIVLSDKGDFELQRKIRDPKTFYKVLFNEIFDNILTNLQARFGSLNKFEFLSLIDPSKYSNYTNVFPNSALENLQESNFGEIFDFIRLRNELIVLYKSKEFLNINPYDLVKKIKMNDLISAFQAVPARWFSGPGAEFRGVPMAVYVN